MEVKAPKPGLLHMDDVSDPDDKEISEDDDDRNHKHRRREEYSQSLEGDSSGQFFTRPYRRQNKNFGNGHPSREGGFSSSDTWKNYNDANQETDLSVRFDKRRPNIPSFSRGTDTNQRTMTNLPMSTDPSPAKVRGRDAVMYGQRDSRFRQVDLAAQLVQHGSIPPNLFSGRGLPTVPHVPGRSWNAFGFIPTIPSGGLDTIHSIGLQVPLRPPLNPSWGMGIPRQRCRDFEERGFCLRGDMCPMEHGVNRIVVDDVQSLSQFNLPAVNALGTSAGQGPLPANASTSTFMSNKGLQIKNGKRSLTDDGMGLNSTFSASSVVGVADLYDPDQPLWTNNGPEIVPARMAVSGSNFNKVEPLTTGKDTSGRHPVALSDGTPSDIPKTSAETTAASQSSSVWGRIGGSKSKLEVKPNTVSTLTPSSNLENEMKKDTDLVEISQGVVQQEQEQEMNADNTGLHVPVSSSKPSSDPGYNFRRPYPKADRTLFVSGIPPKENRREALLSHFKKFGVVIDIYIPSNSERAFVQFSKREEAETALKSPDAIMGNRFIKINWATRDNKPDFRNGGPSNPSDNTKGVTVASGPPSLPVTVRGHDNIQVPAIKGIASITHVALSKSDVTKPTISSPKAPPPSQKKLETLELLKEELRKKQEMLAQKRNEFRRQLDKLEKQATGLKDEGGSDPPSKRHKSEAVVESPKKEIPESATDSGFLSLPLSEKKNDSSSSGENAVSLSSKSVLESRSLKPSIRAVAPPGPPFINKYTLDNRPTVFIVCQPLPAGLATASALKEHFSSYGELAYVDLGTSKDKEKNNDETDAMTVSAHIAYKTRQSAERAFLNGKNWQGHELQLKWEITGGKVGKESAAAANENPSLLAEQSLDADIQSAGETATTGTEIAAAQENIKSKNLNIQEEEKTAQSKILKSGVEEDNHLN